MVNAPQVDPVPTPDLEVVERARDVLAVWFDASPIEADRLLRAWADQTHTPLDELATALVSDIFQGLPSGCQKVVLRSVEANLRQLPANDPRSADHAQ